MFWLKLRLALGWLRFPMNPPSSSMATHQRFQREGPYQRFAHKKLVCQEGQRGPTGEPDRPTVNREMPANEDETDSILGDLLVVTKRYPAGLPVNVVEAEMDFLDKFLQKTYPGNRKGQLDLLAAILKTFPETYVKILAPFNLWEPYKHLLFSFLLDEIGFRYNELSLTGD